MNKLWTISIISISLSVSAISIAVIRCEPLKFDALGWSIGILGMLVTILIGWQIYLVLSVEDRMNKKIEVLMHEYAERINKENIEKLAMSMCGDSYLHYMINEKLGYVNHSKTCLADSLYYIDRSDCKQVTLQTISVLKDVIMQHADSFSTEDKQRIKKILYKYIEDSEDAKELINRL